MARPFKTEGNLDYHRMLNNFYDQLDVINFRSMFGNGFEVGAACDVLLHLICDIYKYKGYYIYVGKNTIPTFARKYEQKVDFIQKVIDKSLESELFLMELYDKYKILTSDWIQEDYISICKRRTKVALVHEYLKAHAIYQQDSIAKNMIVYLSSAETDGQIEIAFNVYQKLFEKGFGEIEVLIKGTRFSANVENNIGVIVNNNSGRKNEKIINVDINPINVDINPINVSNNPVIDDNNSHRKRKSKNKKKESKEKALTPTFEDVLNFFKNEGWQKADAEKFFNHYESVGWKINNQPIENWEARANKWFSDEKTKYNRFPKIKITENQQESQIPVLDISHKLNKFFKTERIDYYADILTDENSRDEYINNLRQLEFCDIESGVINFGSFNELVCSYFNGIDSALKSKFRNRIVEICGENSNFRIIRRDQSA